ncbi:LUD domain-containing protein [Natronorubrum thiooxidans]|uniref:L-lactate dehydrogenase complex protein LldG n=1 Tax=Natronorubrum thiooxidans TaxID=308853 RepID=A0A1N7G1V8_9EURY|nr:LUD domain-containing protein [Natronorubrum thiooxidans]SIS06610.1 L-lactate dehydrogenase complex protein LldG [Natronorubrum thiooxidans]
MSAEIGSIRNRFEASLADLDVPVTRTTPTAFESTLEEIVSDPVVGTSLPFEGVSLPEWVDDEPTPATLEAATTSVTAASLGIADYGSVVLPSTPDGSEQVSLFPDLHVPVLRAADLVADMPTAIERLGPQLRDGGSAIVATGPSATADMGALVKGAHGPKDVHVLVLETEGDAE